MKPAARHIPQLDGLRGLAILLVLAHHCWGYAGISWLGLLGRAGWVGVDLFFVLSGFLITGILLDTRDSPAYFRSFYARRTLRIFPLYYVTLAGLTVAAASLPIGESLLTHAPTARLLSWLYLANWVTNVSGGAHFWSLAVEEQFYLVWPWCVRKLSPLALRRACQGMMVVSLAVRVGLQFGLVGYAGASQVAAGQLIYRNTFCRMDALAVGALCALGLRGHWRLPSPRTLVFLVVAAIAVLMVTGGLFVESAVLVTFGLSAVPIGSAALLLLVMDRPGPLAWPALRRVGTISYGLYLFHFPVFELFLSLHLNRAAALGLALVMSLALAALSFEYLEQPILRLRERFEVSRNLDRTPFQLSRPQHCSTLNTL